MILGFDHVTAKQETGGNSRGRWRLVNEESFRFGGKKVYCGEDQGAEEGRRTQGGIDRQGKSFVLGIIT